MLYALFLNTDKEFHNLGIEYEKIFNDKVSILDADTNVIQINQLMFCMPLHNIIIFDTTRQDKFRNSDEVLTVCDNILKLNNHITFIFIVNKEFFNSCTYCTFNKYFITKPIDKDIFLKVLEQVKINQLLEFGTSGHKLLVRCKSGIVYICEHDIIYLERVSKNTRIVTIKGEYICKERLENIEEKLKKVLFFKCSYSLIVNINYIMRFENNCLFLINDEIVTVTRSSRGELIDLIEAIREICTNKKR